MSRRRRARNAGTQWRSKRWQTLRPQIAERDGWRCQLRYAGCAAPNPGDLAAAGYEVHHIVARARGGGDEPSNLIAVCAACHNVVDNRIQPSRQW